MIHHRQGFERVYDFRERVAPPALDYAAPDEEAEQFFARKAVAFMGLMRERAWANGCARFIERRINRTEAAQWLQSMVQHGELAPLQVEGSNERCYVLCTDVPLLSVLEAGGTPAMWRPLTTTTVDEAVFGERLEQVGDA